MLVLESIILIVFFNYINYNIIRIDEKRLPLHERQSLYFQLLLKTK